MPPIPPVPASSSATSIVGTRTSGDNSVGATADASVVSTVDTTVDPSLADDGGSGFDGTGRATVVPGAGGAPVHGVNAVGARTLPVYSLPATVELGVNTIHRYTDNRVIPSVIAVTVFTPMPTAELPGVVLDMNKKTHAEILPHRCIVGDAGLTRAFIGVDKRPGTPLDITLERILAAAPNRADPEAVIEFVRTEVNRRVAWAPGSYRNDGSAHFPWDTAIKVPQSAWDAFKSVALQNVGDAPVGTGAQFPVVRFEKWLMIGEGYCIQKALLGALLLEKAGVRCRLAQGAVAVGPGKTVGHSWIELEDGRVLDPAWGKIEKPTKRDPDFPDRFFFGGSFRFENQRFPYLAAP